MKLTMWSKKNKARAKEHELEAIRATHKVIDSQQTLGRRSVGSSTAIQCSVAASPRRLSRSKSRARSTHPHNSTIGRLYRQPVSSVPEALTRETAYDHYSLASRRQSMSDLKARQKKILEKTNFQQVRSKTAQPPARLMSSTPDTAVTRSDLQVVKSKRGAMVSPSQSSARPTINVITTEGSDDSPVQSENLRRSSLRAGKFGELIDQNADCSASTTPQGSPTGSTMAVISHSRHSDPVKRDSLDLLVTPTPKTPPGLPVTDDSTPRRTNSNARRTERLRPSPPTLHRSPASRSQSSEELLQQMVELTMQPHTDRQYASHGVITGPRSQKGKEKLTALPSFDSNKPLPAVLSPTRQDNQRTVPSSIRSINVSPPLYNPLANRCFQWVSDSRQTSRPIDAWAIAKRWVCCECQGVTIVEQQICSRLCCQHARCQLACRLAQYAA